jgi:hypothetical protein
MDIYSFLVLLHVVGTVIGTGGVTIAELQIYRALKDKKVSNDERALLHVNYGMIRVGMAILLVSVIGMYWYFKMQGSNILFSDDKTLIKELMFAAIFINALALEKRWVPLWLGSSISFTSWWGATLLGLAGGLAYSFNTYLLGYIVAILVVAGLFKLIRKAIILGYLEGRRKMALIVAIFTLLLLTVYGLIKNEQVARETRQQEQSTVPVAEYRTLEEIVSFAYPGGTHNMQFSFTVDSAGVISSVAAADIDPNNQGKIAEFVTKVNAIVVNQPFATLVPLSRVGGSSLTTKAFNEALTKLQQKEKNQSL